MRGNRFLQRQEQQQTTPLISLQAEGRLNRGLVSSQTVSGAAEVHDSATRSATAVPAAIAEEEPIEPQLSLRQQVEARQAARVDARRLRLALAPIISETVATAAMMTEEEEEEEVVMIGAIDPVAAEGKEDEGDLIESKEAEPSDHISLRICCHRLIFQPL